MDLLLRSLGNPQLGTFLLVLSFLKDTWYRTSHAGYMRQFSNWPCISWLMRHTPEFCPHEAQHVENPAMRSGLFYFSDRWWCWEPAIPLCRPVSWAVVSVHIILLCVIGLFSLCWAQHIQQVLYKTPNFQKFSPCLWLDFSACKLCITQSRKISSSAC